MNWVKVESTLQTGHLCDGKFQHYCNLTLEQLLMGSDSPPWSFFHQFFSPFMAFEEEVHY